MHEGRRVHGTDSPALTLAAQSCTALRALAARCEVCTGGTGPDGDAEGMVCLQELHSFCGSCPPSVARRAAQGQARLIQAEAAKAQRPSWGT